MAYVLRNIENNIISVALDKAQDYTFIEDDDQELIDYYDAVKQKAALEASYGYHEKHHENLCKLFIIELAKKYKDEALESQALQDAAQDVVDNVT